MRLVSYLPHSSAPHLDLSSTLDRPLRLSKVREVCPLDSGTLLPDHIPSHQAHKFYVPIASSSLLRLKWASV